MDCIAHWWRILILSWGMEKSILFIAALKFLIFCRWADLTKRGL
jgi:hypothetical protein